MSYWNRQYANISSKLVNAEQHFALKLDINNLISVLVVDGVRSYDFVNTGV